MGIFIHALSPINRALNWFGHIKRWFALWITYISQESQCNRPKVMTETCKRRKIIKYLGKTILKAAEKGSDELSLYSKKRTVQKTTRTLNSQRECNKIWENLGNRAKTVLSTLINSCQISLNFPNFCLSFALILILYKFFKCPH